MTPERVLRAVLGGLSQKDQAALAAAVQGVPPARRFDFLCDTFRIDRGPRLVLPPGGEETVVGGAPVSAMGLERQVEWAGAPEEYGDEFDNLLHQHAQAAVGEDGHPVSDLARNVRLRDKIEAQSVADSGTQQVSINPVSAKRGTLGNSAQVTSGGPTVQVVNWYGDDNESTLITVTIATNVSNLGTTILPNQTQFQPFADIQWGTRAVPASARVDVGLGTQFTVTGSFVSVSVGASTQSASITVPLNAWISFFGARGTSPVTRTLIFPPVLSTQRTAFLQIPPFASRLLSVSASNAVNWQTQIQFNDYSGVATSVFEVDYSASSPSSFGNIRYAIPNGSYSVAVTNEGPLTITPQLVFELNL